LKNSTGSFVLVSHNRYLLDSVCTSVWEQENGKIERYAGNYSAYRAEKLMKIEKSESAARRQELTIERLEFQIRRLKSWASVYDNPGLARRAKNFERRIERMGEVERIREDNRGLGLKFQNAKTQGDIALDVQNYTRAYGTNPPLIERATFRIRQGERVALVGANGTGKSTLFKDVVALGRWEHETLRVGRAMKVGYMAQMAEVLNPKALLRDEMMRLAGLRRNDAESLLHRFLFTRDDLDKSCGVLSGGEKARVQLAALMASGANFLLLDEPTNHLDIRSRESVEDALEDFPGTLFVISHDRYFLDKIVDRVLYLDPPEITPYEGNFSEFWATRNKRRDEELEEKRLMRERKRLTLKAGRENKLKRIRFDSKRFTFLENEIQRLEARRDGLVSDVEREREKGNTKREETKRKRLEDILAELNKVYEEWFLMGDKRDTYS
jgi:ATP-binding cassette, subfamily F, member 3